MEGMWSCPVALTGQGDVRVLWLSVTSLAEPPLASSPSLLQPEPLVLAPPGTSHRAGSHRWNLEGGLER